MTEIPTIGRIVLYRLTAQNALEINRRRAHAEDNFDEMRRTKTGYQAHVGNAVAAGDMLPMIITSAPLNNKSPWGPVNGKVLLDGSDDFWARRVTGQPLEDRDHISEGYWCWPPRAPEHQLGAKPPEPKNMAEPADRLRAGDAGSGAQEHGFDYYVTRPATIQAREIRVHNIPEIVEAIRQLGGEAHAQGDSIMIKTLEGDMRGVIGSYVARGTLGEFYPIKRSVFERKYRRRD